MKSLLAIIEPKKFSRVSVVGDLHGDYRTLTALLEVVNLGTDLLVFLGDYADRGPDGVEVIRTVATLQQKHPKNVVALMGNHEDFSELGEPQFNPCTLIEEASAKTGSWGNYFTGELKPFIDTLYIAALIPDNALLVHGGVSTKLTGSDDLKMPSEELRLDLLWSDPTNGDGEDPNYARGAGVEFGSDVSASVCKSLGVARIIRSHQPQLAAAKPYVSHGGRVVTVNATSVYGGAPFVYFIDPKSTEKDSYQNVKR
ncbi:MAG: serine/threonine protein phosphatase [Candidatus Bathyarchaeota archaeon]|nr:serine/threonine protein phosphatase [Candidatus Bathyarchaeota archaeon]